MSDNAQTTVISAELNLETSKLESQLTSTKRSLKDLGETFKDVRQKTAEALSAVPTGSGAEKSIEALNRSVIKKTGDVSLAIAAYGTEAQQSIAKAFSNIDIGKEQFKLMSKGAGQGYVDTYIAQLKELDGKIKSSYAIQAQAAEQAAKVSRSAADIEIAANKERAASLKAYLNEVQNAELNMKYTGRGKSSAMLVDKGQRLGFTEAEIGTAVAGLKKVELAQIAAFAAANPHIEKLRAQAEASNTSVKGLSASLRNVPAQFTDIIVSLQGGQAPLTVLLQQGGQLKDMFGGTGNAVRALGGYVVGLVNPFSVAAATAAALGVAFYQGAKESQAFAATLITTGNQAGVTAGQLMGMAKEIDSVAGTQSNAANVLNQLAATGQLTGANLRTAAQAAIEFERAGGQAASETVKQFAELGKAPLTTTLKLNESMGYLTKSTYDQIKSLEEQGRTVEAARIAQGAYTDALNGQTPEMLKNLGLLERGWKGIKDVVSEAGDAVLSIGRTVGAEGQSAAVSQAIKSVEAQLAVRAKAGFTTQLLDAELGKLKERQAFLQSDARLLKSAAESQAQRTREVKAYDEFQKEGDKYLSATAKMELELVRIRNLGISGRLAEEQIVKRQADYLKSQAKAGESGFKPKIDNSAQRELEAEAAILAKLSGVNKDYYEQLTRLQNIRDKGKTTEAQYVELVTELINLQPGVKDEIKRTADALKEQAKAAEEAAKAYDSLYESTVKRSADFAASAQAELDAAAAMGLNAIQIAELEVAKLNEMATSRKRRASVMDDIDLSGAMGEALRDEAKSLLELASAKKLKAQRTMDVDEAKKAADAWRKASEEIERSLTDALMRGFESGKGFAEVLRDTVANMFKTLILRPVIQATVQGGLNTVGLGALGGQGGGAGNLLGSVANNYASSALGSAMFGNSAAYGAALGTASIGAGSQAAMLAAQTGEFGLAGLTATSGAAGGAMAGIGAAMPYVGAVLAFASLLKSLDDSGTMHTGGIGGYSAAGGASTGIAAGLRFGVDPKDYTTSSQDAAVAMARSVAGLLDSTATTFGKQAGYYAATAFADDSSKDGAWGALMLKLGDRVLLDWANTPDRDANVPRVFSDGEAGAKEYAAAVALNVRNLLIEQTPEWADTMLKALGDAPSIDALASTVSQINAAAVAFQAMGRASSAFAGLSDSATSSLVAAMGGIETTVGTLNGYYQNFYTETERVSLATAQITETLAKLGITMPDSIQGFRALVDTALAAGDTGVVAGLLGVQDAFAQVEASAKNTTDALIKQARANAVTQVDAARAASRITLGLPAFAGGGLHSGGIRLVGEVGPEIEVTGPARYYNASQTAAMLSGNGSAEVVSEMRALRTEVVGLRFEARAAASSAAKTAKLIERAMPDGQSLQTTVVT